MAIPTAATTAESLVLLLRKYKRRLLSDIIVRKLSETGIVSIAIYFIMVEVVVVS